MNGFDEVKEKMDNIFLLKQDLHRVLLMGMINENQISSKGPKESIALFLQDAERNEAHYGKLKLRIFHVHWSRIGEDLEL